MKKSDNYYSLFPTTGIVLPATSCKVPVTDFAVMTQLSASERAMNKPDPYRRGVTVDPEFR